MLTCIVAGIVAAFYGVPEEYKIETINHIEADMKAVYEQFVEVKR